MVFSTQTVNRVDIVGFTGRLDASVAPDARARIRELISEGNGLVVLDLSSVKFVDSAGLSVLVTALKAANEKGGDVVLVGLTPNVRSLVELTRLHHVFRIVDTVDQGRALLEKEPEET
jgi:anti-sigma B factor antagonist